MGNTRRKGNATAAKVARMRAEQARAERRRRLMLGGAAVLAVIVLLGGLIVAKLAGAGSRKAAPAHLAGAGFVVNLASSATRLTAVGAGSAGNPPAPVQAPALTADGKPRVLYVGAEYCPFCAAQRWAVAVALSRFGSWTDLGQTTSAAGDVYPNTATLSFHGARLTSDYVSFTGVETTTNQPAGSGYQPLDRLSPGDSALLQKYNAPPYVPASSAGSIPFLDIGGAFVEAGASYSPQLLAGKNQEQIAAALDDPHDPIAQAVGGAANTITAAICRTTGGQPGPVCSAPGVQAAASRIGHGG